VREILTFFVAAYILSWGAWIAANGITTDLPRTALVLLGTFAPGIVALGLTARTLGRRGVIALLRRLIIWQVPLRWYLFAAGYFVAIKLTVAIACRAITGAWPTFGSESWILMLAATLASTLLGGQAGEELGWRGYALPRLTVRFGLGAASVILGLLWACWHLPLFYILGGDTVGQSFPVYLLQVTALSVAMSWLYARTGGSLLLVMLMHAAVNNTKDIVPSAVAHAADPWALSHSLVAWLTATLLWLCAIYFLRRMHSYLIPAQDGES
jgi:membrane protease YdiL (CAAX protease family)